MVNTFLEQSKRIANDFIQNIVFIDDNAYKKDDTTNNAFSASDVSNIFARESKICAVYAPKSISDIEQYNTILKKADVVILDWYINIGKDEKQQLDPEADAETEDPRGEFTLRLISDLLSQTGMLKLIIVYTGETNLSEITNSIYKKAKELKLSFEQEDCNITSTNARVLVRAKSDNSGNQFAHLPELKDKVVSYKDLPNLIINEFTDMTNGLLSNFALSSISTIRNNTSRMLSVFSPKLDPAYLGHKILLEHPSESKHLLIKIFGETISELIENANIDTNDWVHKWIDSYIKDTIIKIEGVSIKRSKDLLKNILYSDRLQLKEKYKDATGGDMPKKIQSDTAKLFTDGNTDTTESNVEFAKLTHHKNIIKPIIGAPVLTLGTVIYDISNTLYYICIQQRCDSVRINEVRRFLFLPLGEKGKLFPLIINNELPLYPANSSYEIKTIKFNPNNSETTIQASKQEDGKYIFKSTYGESYQWVIDLKEMHAQRIVNNYCAALSRVGLNESEWLRLKDKE